MTLASKAKASSKSRRPKDRWPITGKPGRFRLPVKVTQQMGMENILIIYALYSNGDHDLAISLTARTLAMDESVVRMAVES
jgi:hypothetical protein